MKRKITFDNFSFEKLKSRIISFSSNFVKYENISWPDYNLARARINLPGMWKDKGQRLNLIQRAKFYSPVSSHMSPSWLSQRKGLNLPRAFIIQDKDQSWEPRSSTGVISSRQRSKKRHYVYMYNRKSANCIYNTLWSPTKRSTMISFLF